MNVGQYQSMLKNLFAENFGLKADLEWRSKMETGLYSPRVDLAIGPFAYLNGDRFVGEYYQLFEKHHQLLSRLAEIHLRNLGYINQDENEFESLLNEKMAMLADTNYNSRCFIAIEIENNVSRKHLMGGAINASVLGRIGIAVGYNDEKHRAFLNLYRYFEFLKNVDKPTMNTSNLLIVSREQLISVLSKV